MTNKRIIPCLDVKDGRVVKGTQFLNLKDAGDPVELAKYYDEQGADELVLLDISATNEGRKTMVEVVEKIAANISIPFTVGGGIASLEDMKRMIDAGADKVSMSTAAVLQPQLIKEGADFFGPQRIVLAIDGKWDEDMGTWMVYTNGGKKATDKDVVSWAKEAVALGAGEILLTSMDKDGEKSGFHLPLTRTVSESVEVPVIASGGAGSKEHFYEVFDTGGADAGLAASIFHFKETTIKEVKDYLKEKGVDLR